ncbi:MAG: aminodeoxychorismate/anthranilate synthase component II [Termitinemataceae bacterium]|nr:MAG: aminodeoxychorismate/anthranilate synthase component II [Termitinemataceae bacterium]
MILLIDNYDSFSYNLYQLIGSMNPKIKVVRNDKIALDEIASLSPTHIFLSPGPGHPSAAGICEDVIKKFAGLIPIFGVCLGHQAICEVFGATVTYAPTLMHGKASVISIDNKSTIFSTLGETIKAGRYHSLAAKSSTMPQCLKVIGTADDGAIMAVEHVSHAVYGVQFHPESILTPQGAVIVKNFLGTP